MVIPQEKRKCCRVIVGGADAQIHNASTVDVALGFLFGGLPQKDGALTAGCLPLHPVLPCLRAFVQTPLSPETLFLVHVHVLLIIRDQLPYCLLHEAPLTPMSSHWSSFYSFLCMSPSQDTVG